MSNKHAAELAYKALTEELKLLNTYLRYYISREFFFFGFNLLFKVNI